MTDSIVRAERVPFNLTPNPKHAIIFFRLPCGEKRVGLTSASSVCGLNEGYLSTLSKRPSKRLKALTDLGFTGRQVQVSVTHEFYSGSTRSETLIRRGSKDFAWATAPYSRTTGEASDTRTD